MKSINIRPWHSPHYSCLQVVTKVKLYKYIYVYKAKIRLIGKGIIPKFPPKYHFPRHLNIPTTNKFTITSVKTSRIYLKQMDHNQENICLEIASNDEHLNMQILKQLKRIKYFSLTRYNYLGN